MAIIIQQIGIPERYRDFDMYAPSGLHSCWSALHKDADEDDARSVTAKNRAELISEIDEWYADHSWERQEIYRLRDLLRKQAVRFDDCARMIEQGFQISGTLRSEHHAKARAYADECRALLTEGS